MNYAATERAALSRRHIGKRYGQLLSRWADARRNEWRIDDSWTVERLLTHITALRETNEWKLLEKPKALVRIDRVVRIFLSCEPRRVLPNDEPARLTIEQIEQRMCTDMPDLSRARLRSLLHRATRKDVVIRLKRGQYEESSDESFWHRRWAKLDEDERESEGRWMRRAWIKEQRCASVFACHYLLSHVSSYRKARQLSMSDRAYFYALNGALERIETVTGSGRRNVQS